MRGIDIDKLDPDQVEVMGWSPQEGNLRVVAAAGSGKTTTLVALIAKLILVDEVDPRRILVATFANKAANEMKKKLKHAIGAYLDRLVVGTFHGLGLEALQAVDPQFWTTARCVDLDKTSRATETPHIMSLYRSAVVFGSMPGTNETSLKLSDYPEEYRTCIDLLRARGYDEPKFTETYMGPHMLRDVWFMLQRAKKALRVWEFNDVLSEWRKLLIDNRAQKYDIVIIDEAQDNTFIQLDLAQHLCTPETGRIVMCGDLRQTIHVWRGAYPSLFETADQVLNAKTKELKTNYRSDQTIVALANDYARDKRWKLGSDSLSVRNLRRSCIDWIGCTSFYDQAERIADAWTDEHPADGGPSSAFLVRTNGLLMVAETTMLLRQIPYTVQGGSSLFAHSATKAFVSYLKAVNLTGKLAIESLLEVINTPKRFVPTTFSVALKSAKEYPGERLTQVIRRIADQSNLSKTTLRNLLDLCYWIEGAQKTPFAEQVKATHRLLKESWVDVGEAHENDGIAILGALSSFAPRFRVADEFFAFMEKAVRTKHDPKEGPHIVLSTIHRAKGLEWDHVYMDATHGMLPHKKATSREQAEEEQRLLYVAMTRAKNNLSIMYVDDKTKEYGEIGGLSQLLRKLAPKTEDITTTRGAA